MSQAGAFLSRRKLLFVAGAAGTAAGAAMIAPIRNVATSTIRVALQNQPALRRWLQPLGSAGYDDWMEQVGQTFTVGGGTSMKLVGVRAFAASGTRPRGLARDRAFVASFDVLNRRTLPGELIYTVSHPTLGPFQLFMSAGDPRTPGRMLAVFN